MVFLEIFPAVYMCLPPCLFIYPLLTSYQKPLFMRSGIFTVMPVRIQMQVSEL
jgi:hypothetical protein